MSCLCEGRFNIILFFQTELYVLLHSPIHTTCLPRLILSDLLELIMFEELKL